MQISAVVTDTIFIDEPNIYWDDYKAYSGSVPYLLKLKKVPNRFVKRITSDDKVELQFGAGISDNPDEIIIPNPSDYNNIAVNDISGVEPNGKTKQLLNSSGKTV